MKYPLFATKLFSLAFLLFLLPVANKVVGQNMASKSTIGKQADHKMHSFTFPFSQYVIRSDWAMPITWKYRPYSGITENENVIEPPAFGEDWDAWFTKMKLYQRFLRGNLRDTNALYLEMKIPKGNSIRLHYKRVFNPLRIQPNDEITFNGFAKNNKGNTNFSIQLIYIKIGQELSHAIVKTDKIDNVTITETATNLHKSFKIPDYDTKNLMVQPVVFFSSQNNDTTVVEISNLTVSVTSNAFNQQKFDEEKPSFYATNTAVDRQLYDRKEMQWVKSNFVSGFAYIWDTDFWDAEKKRFTVQKYCDKMKAAFNGFQSVLFWYSYPNIGIDNRNTWEIFNAVPGGMDSLKAMVKAFHKNGVKVYFPYTPWEIDTRKTDTFSDAEHWGKILQQIDGDGLFFDTFFDGGDFQATLDKYKKGISIGTEHHPSLQNIQGYNAVTTSWGQTIEPYKNNGISRLKWVIPEHIQWKINRNERDRQNSLAYSWVNGQGILVWENVFGYMNKWNAKDRQALRKMNTIYQAFYNLYTSDSWKPYLPSARPDIHISSWENTTTKIWNIVTDSANVVATFELPVDKNFSFYYDAWTGEKLPLNYHSISVPIQRFGCVIGLKSMPSPSILSMLKKQSAETLEPLPALDDYIVSVSDKLAKLPPAISKQHTSFAIDNLLPIKAGDYKLTAEHFRREGNCYPDENAKNNDDYKVVKNSFNNYMIVHTTEQKLPDMQVMQSVVTNGQFAAFLTATNYRPEDTTNFLQHWHGKKCPDSLLEKPVVYVSLEDARAFAKWAGMRLPTEWEWQAAGETNGEKFKFNEVWEWNESERYDGNNYFVTLRGGCSNWQLQTSNWYFPGTPNNQKPGGPQPLNSHCKYYILHAGYDRAGTLGFRCIK